MHKVRPPHLNHTVDIRACIKADQVRSYYGYFYLSALNDTLARDEHNVRRREVTVQIRKKKRDDMLLERRTRNIDPCSLVRHSLLPI